MQRGQHADCSVTIHSKDDRNSKHDLLTTKIFKIIELFASVCASAAYCMHITRRSWCTVARAFCQARVLQWITLYQPWSACILTGTTRRSIRRRRWRMWRIPRRAAASPPTRSCTVVPRSRIRSKPAAAKGPHPKFHKRITVKTKLRAVRCVVHHKRLTFDGRVWSQIYRVPKL